MNFRKEDKELIDGHIEAMSKENKSVCVERTLKDYIQAIEDKYPVETEQYSAVYNPPEKKINMDAIMDALNKQEEQKTYKHYFKDVTNLDYIDIYRVISLWNVTDPCIQHAVKKLLVAGNRGYKDVEKDIQEAIDSLERWKQMQGEDNA